MSKESRAKKKLIRELFASLRGTADLSRDKGRWLPGTYPRVNSKVRRHSGRVYPLLFGPQKILDEEGIPTDYYYNDWVDYRDGWRDNCDSNKLRKSKGKYWIDKEIIESMNKKIIKQIQIRKIRKTIVK